MPELPEVEHLRRTLLPRVASRTVVRAILHRRDIAVRPGDPPGGFARQRRPVRPTRLLAAELLAGSTIDRIERRGKLLALVARDGRALGVHLGMTGQLLWAPAGGRLPTDHVHATWRLDDRSRLVFRDPRRFGGLWAFPSRDELPPWKGLGPDALELAPGDWAKLFARARRPIKAALLDQGLVAGVGNIYADEALHQAGIHPGATASELSEAQALALGAAVGCLLALALQAGGSTLRDYRGAEGQPGAFQLQHRVYGRAGQPCLACGRTLRVGLLGQRTTVWCDRCQPKTDQPRGHRETPSPKMAHFTNELSTRASRRGIV